MTAPDRAGTGRRRRRTRAAAGTLTLLAGAGLAALSAGPTDAAYVTSETGTVVVAADVVRPPTPACTVTAGQAHRLALTPAAEGPRIVEYRVVARMNANSPGSPGGLWATSTTLPALDQEVTVPAPSDGGPVTVTWGIRSNGPFHSATYRGTVTVHAVGPGGWTSSPVSQPWTIAFSAGVATTATCT